MANAIGRSARQIRNRPPFECIALVLQGGGALGAYQCGVYEALAEAAVEPDWTAGISIGAFNAAIIAGNPPEARVEKLRKFWQIVTGLYGHAPIPAARLDAAAQAGVPAPLGPTGFWASAWDSTPMLKGDAARSFLNQCAAGRVVFAGAPGFFCTSTGIAVALAQGHDRGNQLL
jgi:NTE family protein